MKIGIVAGEPSGDYLAAHLIEAIRDKRPDIRVEGIGGERLREAGCDILFPMEKLAVMGLVEVAGKLWELSVVRAKLAERFITDPPDVFIGVDAPDFNLGLERKLRKKGIKTIHYVCPTAWAWRGWRVRGIRKSADLMLSVFPFEPAFFHRHGVPIKYVGHPLARQVDMQPDTEGARRRLGLPLRGITVALLPGSRRSELNRLADPFFETAAWLDARYDGIRFVSNAVNDDAERCLRAAAQRNGITVENCEGQDRGYLDCSGCGISRFGYRYPGSDVAQGPDGGGIQDAQPDVLDGTGVDKSEFRVIAQPAGRSRPRARVLSVGL